MLGSRYKELRINKNYSINQVSNGSLSKSFISRFENDLSDISLTNLIKLLDRINVSMQEFIYNQELSSESYLELEKKSAFAYHTNDLLKLNAIEVEQQNKFLITANPVNHANAIMLKAMQFDLTNIPLDKSEIKFMNQYLFSIETWGEYEFTLFNYSVLAFPVQESINWGLALLKKYRPYSNKENFPNELVFLFGSMSNLLISCINQGRVHEANLLSDELNKFKLPETRYQLRVKFEYLKGLVMYLDGDTLNGEAHAWDAINIMKFIGVKNDYQDHLAHLTKFLKQN